MVQSNRRRTRSMARRDTGTPPPVLPKIFCRVSLERYDSVNPEKSEAEKRREISARAAESCLIREPQPLPQPQIETATIDSTSDENATITREILARAAESRLSLEPQRSTVKTREQEAIEKPAKCVLKNARRKNQFVLYDEDGKQFYKVNKKYAEKTAYTCCVDRCPSRIIRHSNGQCFYPSDYKPHNHVETAEQTVAVNEFKNTLKQKGSNLNYPDK